MLIRNISYLSNIHGIKSVAKLAEKLEINQPTLHRTLSGEVKDPKYSTLKTIAEFFGRTVTELMECDLRGILDPGFTKIYPAENIFSGFDEDKKTTTTLSIAATIIDKIEPAVIEVVKHKVMAGASREDVISAAETTAEAIAKGMTFMLKDLRA